MTKNVTKNLMKAKNNLQAFKTNPTKGLNRPISFCFVHEYDTVTGNGLDSRFLVNSFEEKKKIKGGEPTVIF